MTLRELYSLPFLEQEIEDYKAKILELEEMAESTTAKLSGMPGGGGVSDKVGEGATAIVLYQTFLATAIKEKTERELEITRYIESIDDAELRRIMYLRFVQRKTWREVADSIGGNNNEDSVRKRCNRFVNNCVATSDMSGRVAL